MKKEYLCQLIAEELDLDWEQVRDNFNFEEDDFDINKASEELLNMTEEPVA